MRIAEKLAGYWQAAQESEEEYFLYVVLIVMHQGRRAGLERVIRKLPEARWEMVRVCPLADLVNGFPYYETKPLYCVPSTGEPP